MSLLPLPVTSTERLSCQVTPVLQRVGEKWGVLLLAVLSTGPHGFNELDRTIEGLSRRILVRTLRGLESDGLISRNVTADRVEYALTDLGRSLLPLITALGEWAVEHAEEMDRARREFCGQRTYRT